ncbi:M15 family metallopeptidase [Streptomyces wedmorensis]|uniref:M15 family metallopeptidase n=1 Tax=Streptomyces wedmorensis TaxID=43759 RepID=UPI0034492DA2
MSTYECECGGHRGAADAGSAGAVAPELREYAAETGLLGGEYGSPLTEAEESALAAELLGVADEQELEAFLGSFLAPVARRDGGFLSSTAGAALGGVLKNVALTALPGRGTGSTGPGRQVVDRVPMLRRHAGTPSDLILKWNAMERPSRIDVVVHLHGFAVRGRSMTLPVDMEAVSGLDFGASPARTAPTLLVLPRGHHFGGRSGRGYTHSALEPPGAVQRLVAEALARFKAATGVDAPLGRLVLTAHSGGGASLMRILRHTDPDEVHTFDALYGDPAPLVAWARRRIAGGTGALRVLYRPYEPTARHSEQVAAAVRPASSPRFRVEWTKVPHMRIPRLYGPLLLADAAADLPGTGRAPAPRLRSGHANAVREVADEVTAFPGHSDGEAEGETGGGWSGTPDQVAFRQRVLDAHLARTRKRKGRPGRDLTPRELAPVPGASISMRTDAAAAAGRLLAAAGAALAEARAAGDEDAGRTRRLTGGSGYRGSDHQQRLWLGYFRNYYTQTASARAGLPGGPHGDGAVRYMLDVFGIPARIAAPGYSNHQNGIAIDFLQVRARGHALRNSTGAQAVRRWQATWFFRWLQANAHRFGFVPYAREPWHWVHQGAGSRPVASDRRTEPRPRPLLENPAAELFGLEAESGDPRESEFEVARRFVRLSAAAARNAAMAPRDRYRRYRPYRGRAGDGAVGRAAVFAAARRYAPGLYRAFPRYARPAPWHWPRPLPPARRPRYGRGRRYVHPGYGFGVEDTAEPEPTAPYGPESHEPAAHRPPPYEPDPYEPGAPEPAPYPDAGPGPAGGGPDAGAAPGGTPPGAAEPTGQAAATGPPGGPEPDTSPPGSASGPPAAEAAAAPRPVPGRGDGTWVRRGDRVMIVEA